MQTANNPKAMQAHKTSFCWAYCGLELTISSFIQFNLKVVCDGVVNVRNTSPVASSVLLLDFSFRSAHFCKCIDSLPRRGCHNPASLRIRNAKRDSHSSGQPLCGIIIAWVASRLSRERVLARASSPISLLLPATSRNSACPSRVLRLPASCSSLSSIFGFPFRVSYHSRSNNSPVTL
jgi:hypothetical protein